jgi:hypothetical protein
MHFNKYEEYKVLVLVNFYYLTELINKIKNDQMRKKWSTKKKPMKNIGSNIYIKVIHFNDL